MKRLLLIFILTFSFQTLTKADDIRDFQIGGMSVGDSLLDYFSENEIKDNLSSKLSFYYKNNVFAVIPVFLKNIASNYDDYSVTIMPNDDKYKIYATEGRIFFDNDIDNCMKKRDQIVNDIKSSDNTHKFSSYEGKHGYDKSGKSFVYAKEIEFTDGAEIRIYCTDWSKEISFKDSLKVIASSGKLLDWINKEAYD